MVESIPAKSFIVEALALSPSDIISAVVQSICQDRETQFMVNLEGGKRSTDAENSPRWLYYSNAELSNVLLTYQSGSKFNLTSCIGLFLTDRLATMILETEAPSSPSLCSIFWAFYYFDQLLTTLFCEAACLLSLYRLLSFSYRTHRSLRYAWSFWILFWWPLPHFANENSHWRLGTKLFGYC